MPSEEKLATFHDSYERLQKDDAFFDLWYEKLINHSEEIAAIFNGVDLSRVKKTVKQSLIYNLMAAGDFEIGRRKLKSLARSHEELGVEHHHLDVWCKTLVDTVKEKDPKFSADVEAAWVDVMGVGIELMKASYSSASTDK